MGCPELRSLWGSWAGCRHLEGTGARPEVLGQGKLQLRWGSCSHRDVLFSDPSKALGLMNFSGKQDLSFRFQDTWPRLLGSIYCLKTCQGPRKGPLTKFSDTWAGVRDWQFTNPPGSPFEQGGW